MIDKAKIRDLLKVKGKFLYHREGQSLEFKEQFNLAGLADYFRDFAAFANNRGGYLIFGVTDSPRVASGLSQKALEAFNKIDPEKITGFLLDTFSSSISWEQAIVEIDGKYFGVFWIDPADTKPVIARRDEGKEQSIRNGDIYFRYGGRTQRIQSAELENIIYRRIERANKDWIDLVREIGPAGPSKALVLKSSQQIEDGRGGSFVVDQKLIQKLKFIKEGHFDQKDGATTLKLVGDVVPVDTVEVEKVVKENLLKEYPYSATELAAEVQKQCKCTGRNAIWRAIADNGVKNDPDYSAYNFRNNRQQDQYNKTGKVTSTTPSLYNKNAVDLLVKLLK